MKKYQRIAVGGTFDHLHRGHEKILATAFASGFHVVIGLTSDQMAKDKEFGRSLESFSLRKKNLKEYLQKRRWLERGKIITLNDPFGPLLFDKNYQALVVTANTKKNGEVINKKRKEKNLPLLDLIEVELVNADDGEVISSERIRKGEINRMGKSYMREVEKNFQEKNRLILPKNLKEKLRIPLGKVFVGKEKEILTVGKKLVNYIKKYQPVLTIAVGDVINYALMANNLVPSIKIIDHRTRRKELSQEFKEKLGSKFHFEVNNEAGGLDFLAVKSIKMAVENFLTKNEFQQIFVNGEEDLLTLPAILFSPLKSMVIYGHWQLGVVAVEVDEKEKEMALRLIKKFRKE